MTDEVFEWAERYFNGWADQLSLEALHAIHFYQLDEGAAELNAWFRHGTPPTNLEQARQVSQLLDDVLHQVRIDRPLIVYRGVGSRDRVRFPDDLIESLARVNGVIEDRGYLSTSLDVSISVSDFAGAEGTIYEIAVPPQAFAAYLGHSRVSRAERRYQSEMLFRRGSFLTIRRVEYGKNGVARWITVEMR